MQQRVLRRTPLHLLLRQQRGHQRRRRQLGRRHHDVHKRLQTREHHNRLLVPLLTTFTYFRRYVLFSHCSTDGVLRAYPLFLRGVAADWYDQLSDRCMKAHNS